MTKRNLMKSKKVCYRSKKEFNTDKNDKNDLNYSIKQQIIVIILKNIEELLIIFVIEDIKHKRNFCSISYWLYI